MLSVHIDRWETFMINLNSATAAELDAVTQLRGHGFEIVRYRDERGSFSNVRQLEEVPGLAGKWNGAEAVVSVG
jgi:DNA uptake protein ComE-like DNA-binding protein